MISFAKYKKRILLFLFSVVVYLTAISKFHFSTLKVKVNVEAKNECQIEWTQLNEHVFIRNTLVFYYRDLNLIRIYLERNSDFNYEHKIQVAVVSSRSEIQKYNLTKVARYGIYGSSNYIFEYLEVEFHLNRTEFKKLEINLASSLINKTNSRADLVTLTDVIIKNYNEKDELKENSILCSKVYHFDKSYEKIFEWWIEMSRLNGYDKLVLFNNSLPFPDLFQKYKDFVQVVQFQCLPNFFSNSTNKKRFIQFEDIKNVYKIDPAGLHLHFEYFTFNECYLTNKDKYKYISIMDQDESIIPRRPLFLNDSSKWPQFKTSPSSQPYELISYLNDLSKEFKAIKKKAYSFKMGVYLKHETTRVIFNALDKFLKESGNHSLNVYNFTIQIRDQNQKNQWRDELNFSFLINDKQDLDYVKYMHSMYFNHVKPFLLKNNQSLNKIVEPFNRLYMLMGANSTMFLWGKTIHDTLQTHSLYTHSSLHGLSDLIEVPMEHGHLSHFRNGYNIYWNTYPIKEFHFDFNYFQNYYLPILKRLDYSIRF